MGKSNIRNTIDYLNISLLLSCVLFFFMLLEILPLLEHCSADNICLRNRPESTRKICQLTGEYDKEGWDGLEPLDPNYRTLNRTASRYGLHGMDLGASFAYTTGNENRVYFLFGDTVVADPSINARDSLAYTTDTNFSDCVDLTFNDSPPSVSPPINQTYCSVPTEGISYNGKMYVYFIESDALHNMCGDGLAKSHLTVSTDGGYTFDEKYVLSTYSNSAPGKFVNVQVEAVENSNDIDYNGVRSMLPLEVRNYPVLFIWGSGKFRNSNPFLAYMPLSSPFSIEDKSTIRYFTRLDESGIPMWSTNELDAGPLFDDAVLGEFSVSWNADLKKWLMLYRGVAYRTADYPWGPWSPYRQSLFNQDYGYCSFIHRGDCTELSFFDGCIYEEPCDNNKDYYQFDGCANCDCRGGGAYAPYIISSNGIQNQESTIYYTLSTWNPYQVMLMQSTLEVFLDAIPPIITSEPGKYENVLPPDIILSTNPAEPTTIAERDAVIWKNNDDDCGVGRVTWQQQEYASGGNWISHDITYIDRWGDLSVCYPGVALAPGKYEFRILIADVAENISTSKTYYINIVHDSDIDSDGIVDDNDNCPNHCNPDQLDSYPPQGNGMGDACDCECNFDYDLDVDGTDSVHFKKHFGRKPPYTSCTNELPCKGDFACDGDVDGTDAALFKKDFGRKERINQCNTSCAQTQWCNY